LSADVGVVTGAASGIGRATAERLLADGRIVVGVDRDAAGLESVAAVVAFLLSEDASFLAGELVNVDGGAAARCFRYAPQPDIARRPA
jgi:NAD(P)-dependent dehydrogenase (short-subunit alcohol dehydrogenase family)